jgi:hypothetical protein
MAAFPGDRAADLIARLAEWRAEHVPHLDWHTALERYVASQDGDDGGTVKSSSRKG